MRTIGIGYQNFEEIITEQSFYVDKTRFIKEWWENKDRVTLITRPRRFGKTLGISMVETFFSVDYSEKSSLFDGLFISSDAKLMAIQGTYPVIALSFAEIKESTFVEARKKICQLISDLYSKYHFLTESEGMTEKEIEFFDGISSEMEDYVAALSIKKLSSYLYTYYNKKVIILLDEYDTPMQEAYVQGYWTELSAFIRGLFNSTFKTNPYMERAIMTGITRVSKESVFSDLNNLEVVTTTSEKYEDAFGFTETEVFQALEEYGLEDHRAQIRFWYDGFTFGHVPDIYNPWSIINFLDKRKIAPYWANTSSNHLVSKLIRQGSRTVKMDFEQLLGGGILKMTLDEQIIFNQLDTKESAIWSLLLASGYLKVCRYTLDEKNGRIYYDVALTNKEVRVMFSEIVREWFLEYESGYGEFIKALLLGDVDAMNEYMNRVALATFSYFDTGNHPSDVTEPERFYHGFVLGLMVDLADKYVISSNRESGFGRYDVMLEPLTKELDAIILEFKVFNPKQETTMEDTVLAALDQIKSMKYDSILIAKGISKAHIRHYGFAFKGKRVLIGE